MILNLAFSSLVVISHVIYFALSGCDQTLQYMSFQSENFALSRIRLSVSITLKCSSSYRFVAVSIILQKLPLSIFIFHALLTAYDPIYPGNPKYPAAGYPAAPIPLTFISFHPPLFLILRPGTHCFQRPVYFPLFALYSSSVFRMYSPFAPTYIVRLCSIRYSSSSIEIDVPSIISLYML